MMGTRTVCLAAPSLEVLVKLVRCLLEAAACEIKIGVGFQGESDKISGLQRLNDDMQILIAATDACRSLAQKPMNGLQVVQYDALIGEMQSVRVTVQSSFELDRFAVVIGKSRGNGSIHSVQQFPESGGIGRSQSAFSAFRSREPRARRLLPSTLLVPWHD